MIANIKAEASLGRTAIFTTFPPLTPNIEYTGQCVTVAKFHVFSQFSSIFKRLSIYLKAEHSVIPVVSVLRYPNGPGVSPIRPDISGFFALITDHPKR